MSSPIGILDSGLGGLSVLNEIRKLMPGEDIVYFADSAWCPYGPRHPEEIQRRVFAITDFLLAKHCKLIVIACNSATIAAVEALRATYPVPFVGMEPAVKPAAAMTRSGTIGVLATEASLAGKKFHRLLHDHAEGVNIITRPCPNFVKLVETGELNSPRARGIVEEETQPLVDAGADVIVLGCTHYPYLRHLIQDVAGPDVKIIDTGAAVARHALQVLKNKGQPATPHTSCQVITTGELDTLKKLFPTLCPGIQADLSYSNQIIC